MSATLELRYEFMAIAFASALLAVDEVLKIKGMTQNIVEKMSPKKFVEIANGTLILQRNIVETRSGLNSNKKQKTEEVQLSRMKQEDVLINADILIHAFNFFKESLKSWTQITSQGDGSKPDTPFGAGIPILRSNVLTMEGFSVFARSAFPGQLSQITNASLTTNSESRYIAITNAIKSVSDDLLRRRGLVPNADHTSMSVIIAPMAMIEVLSAAGISKTAASTNTNSDSDWADAYYALVENEDDELLYTYQELG